MRSFILPALSLLLLCLTAPPIAAEDTVPTMEEVSAAFSAGDLETARTQLERLIRDTPSPLAQFRYGRMLIEGMGGPADPEAGVQWMAGAANGGHLGALTYIGRLRLSEGPGRDPAQAAQHFHAAAARGDREAKYYLGLLHSWGQGVAKDPERARTWLLAAAEDGYGPAQYELTKLHGTAPAEAQRWLEEAALSGVPEAQFAVAAGLQSRSAPVTQVVDLYTRAAQAGFVPAQRALGTLYLTGADGLSPDAERAVAWLGRAAEARDLTAVLNLGLGYLSGSVLPANPEQAENLLLVASDNGAHQASLALSRGHKDGSFASANPQDALLFLRLAQEQGSTRAAVELGHMVLDEDPALQVAPHDAVPWVMARLDTLDDAAAFDWLDKHARQGVQPAQAALGQWLLPQDGKSAQALPYLEAAARGGHVPSQARLGQALTTGLGGTLDYVAAHGWLNIAAASGHAASAETRDTITDLMTPEDIAAAQDFARRFFDESRASPPTAGVPME